MALELDSQPVHEPRVAPVRLFNADFVELLIAQLSFGYSFSAFFLLPKFMAVELAAGPREIGAVMSAFAIAAVLLVPLVGIWVDRAGHRRFMFAGSVLTAVSALGFLVVDSVGPMIYALRALSGAAFALYFISAATLAASYAPPARLAQALGLFGVTMLAMNAIAPALSETLAERVGWAPVFWLIAATSMVGGLLALRLRPPQRSNEGPARLRELIVRPQIWPIAVVVALVGAGFGALFTFHQPHALEVGITEVRGFFISYAIAALVVRSGLGWMADHFGRYPVAIAFMLAFGLAPLGLIDLGPGRLEWVGVFFGVGHGVLFPALNALVIDAAGEQDRGKATAIYIGAFNAGFGLGAFALGFVAESAGFPAVWVTTAGISAVALVTLVWAWQRARVSS